MVQNVYISTKNGLSLAIIGFFLKGATINSDFFFFNPPLLEKGTARGERVGRETEIVSGTGNSDRRAYVGGAEGEAESEC